MSVRKALCANAQERATLSWMNETAGSGSIAGIGSGTGSVTGICWVSRSVLYSGFIHNEWEVGLDGL